MNMETNRKNKLMEERRDEMKEIEKRNKKKQPIPLDKHLCFFVNFYFSNKMIVTQWRL